MEAGPLPVSQRGGSPSLLALCVCGSCIRASASGRNPVVSSLHPCLVSLQSPAQSVEDPAASPAQDPSWVALTAAPSWGVPELWGQQAGCAQVSCPGAGTELCPLPCLAGTSLPALLPQPCTIRYLVTHYLDISCVPRRSFFELLSYFSTNELEREKLQEFSSAQGQEELYSYCNRPRRTTLEVRLGERGKPVL